MSTAPESISVDFLKAPILLKVAGGPVGPPGPPNAGVYLKGVASAWPPATTPAVGDLWVVPTTPPAGAPAWALAGHGAFWDGNTWVDAGILGGPKGDRGEPGPPLNIRGTAVSWVPDSHPKPGDLWILPDPLPVGTPAGFAAGGAAGWDAVAGAWIPLAAIRGPAGRSIQVFGPSPAPPVGVPIFKGDVWLASDPSLFSPTFDPSTIRPIPGPPGPNGPTGLSAFEFWKTTVGRPTAAISDYLDAIKGAPGATGAKGPAGETLKVAGVVPDEAHLPATPPNLTVYMTRDGILWIYNPTSAAAAASGWVNLGKIAGPAGQPATMTPAVATDADRPAVGLPGQMVYVTATGHVWGWDDVAKVWVDGGKFGIGAGSVDDGTTQGDSLSWDATARRWAAVQLLRLPAGSDDGDIVTWDAALGQWVSTVREMGSESNVDLPQTPADGEGSVPVYDYDTNRFDVRRLKLEDLDDGPGAYVPADGELLGWDSVLNRWVPSPAPAGTLAGLTDVTTTPAATGDVLASDGVGRWHPKPPAGYTKAEVDAKVAALVAGIEHEVSVLSRKDAPPTSPPVQYDLHIVGATPTGAWAGHPNEIAEWDGTAWTFTAPRNNEAHLVEDETATYVWNGTVWTKIAVAATGGSSASAGVGEIVPWVGDTFPTTDYLECNGQIVAVAAYQDLHNAIGNKYNAGTGADGTTTFAVPNLQGEFLRGIKTGLAVGQHHDWTTGRPRTAFTTDAQGNHRHGMTFQGLTAHGGATIGESRSGVNNPNNLIGDPAGPHFTDTTGAHTHTITGGGDAETAPDFFVVRYLIRHKPINGGAVGPRGPVGPTAAPGELWQVGSIQQSMLTESQWTTTLGADAGKWVLADGRDVTGSRWATLTGQTRIPDLRGAFIRAAGQNNNAGVNWNGGAVGSYHDDTTRIPRNTAFTLDNQGSHTHPIDGVGDHTHTQSVAAYTGSGASTWSGSPVGGRSESTGSAGGHSHTMHAAGGHTHTISGGDAQTAPVHYSLNTFIKVN